MVIMRFFEGNTEIHCLFIRSNNNLIYGSITIFYEIIPIQSSLSTKKRIRDG